MWHLFDCFRTEEVCVRQTMLKMAMGVKKQTSKKTADYQQRLDSLQSQFDGKIITIDALFQGLTLLMATQRRRADKAIFRPTLELIYLYQV